MTAEKRPTILLIAGDYDIIRRVRDALPSTRFVVENAFNHRDALYWLEYTRYAAILVDAAMTDRHSGQSTLQALAALERTEPIAAFRRSNATRTALAGVIPRHILAIPDLEPATIAQAVTQALDLVGAIWSADDETPIHARAEMNTFLALSRSLTEVLELSEVLNRIVEAARRLTDAEEGMILLPEGEELYLRAKVGIDEESAQNFRIKTQDTLAGGVFHGGEPVLVSASGPQKVKTEYFVNSLLYVPILLKGEIIGVLGVNNRNKEDPFTPHDQRLLLNLAAFAAIALENARVHQESLDRAHELETLVDASAVLNDSLFLQDTLLGVGRQLAAALQAGYVEILRWNPPEDWLDTQAYWFREIWRFGQGPEIRLANCPTLQTAFAAGQPQWVDWAAQAATEICLIVTGAQTMLVLPVISDQQRLGCIRCFYATPPAARPAAEIIRQAWRIGLETLAELAGRRDRTLPTDTLEAAQEMTQLVGADWCDLALSTGNPQIFPLVLRIGSKVWLEPTLRLGISRHADLTRILHMLTVTQEHPHGRLATGMRTFLEKTQGGVVLGVPLIRRGVAQGLAVVVATERHRRFTEREIDLARAIVGQAATALENATLVHDLEISLRDLRNAQDQLVQTARLSAMGELAAVVAHQINNPLTTIIADTELLLLDEPAESAHYPPLQAILRAGQRAANVARRLLMIARPFDATAKPVNVDVVDSLRGVLSLLQAHIERRGILVRVDYPPEALPPVKAVRGQLEDVWINLLLNAYDALTGQPNGEIGIEVAPHPPEQRIEVCIWDNGPGIPAAIQEQIFQPFFTTKPAGEGSGLGLHICRQVVERIGGRISVASSPGQPTRFRVTLPATEAAPLNED